MDRQQRIPVKLNKFVLQKRMSICYRCYIIECIEMKPNLMFPLLGV